MSLKDKIDKLKRYGLSQDSIVEHSFGEYVKYDDVVLLLETQKPKMEKKEIEVKCPKCYCIFKYLKYIIKDSRGKIDCNECELYGECDHQGAYQKDGKWCYEDLGNEKEMRSVEILDLKWLFEWVFSIPQRKYISELIIKKDGLRKKYFLDMKLPKMKEESTEGFTEEQWKAFVKELENVEYDDELAQFYFERKNKYKISKDVKL